jgi:hypothetical protein
MDGMYSHFPRAVKENRLVHKPSSHQSLIEFDLSEGEMRPSELNQVLTVSSARSRLIL